MNNQIDYRKLFVITRELQKKNMPDDLMQLTLEFVGDLNESCEDLMNKYAFCKISNVVTKTTYGHYCYYCDRVLWFKTRKGLMRHVKSWIHEDNLENKKMRKSKMGIIKMFKRKYNWRAFYKNLGEQFIEVVDIEYKKHS